MSACYTFTHGPVTPFGAGWSSEAVKAYARLIVDAAYAQAGTGCELYQLQTAGHINVRGEDVKMF